MHRARGTMRQSAAMEAASATQQWPVAKVVLQQYNVEISEVNILDNAGSWFHAIDGAKEVTYGNTVGVRAKARNMSPVTAFVSIQVHLLRPDGSKAIAPMWSGNVAAGGLTSYSSITEKSNQVGSYNSIVVAVISA